MIKLSKSIDSLFRDFSAVHRAGILMEIQSGYFVIEIREFKVVVLEVLQIKSISSVRCLVLFKNNNIYYSFLGDSNKIFDEILIIKKES